MKGLVHSGFLAFISLGAGILFVLMGVDVHANTCDNAAANTVFVDATNKVLVATNLPEKDKSEALSGALDNLRRITKDHSCTSVVVLLASGQSIGEISIAGLTREIMPPNMVTPQSCQTTPLHDAIKHALAIRNNYLRNDVIATIARKLVRCDAYTCAHDLVDLIDENKKKNELQQHIVRAQVRAGLKNVRCCYRSWPC